MSAQTLMIAVMAALSINAFGQGQVILANNAFSLIRIGDPGTPAPIGSLTFQLYSGPNADSLTPLFPTAPTSAVSAGRIANTIYFIPSAPNGQIATFQIRAWDSAFATLDDAVAAGALRGRSEIFTSATSMQNPGDPPPIPVSLAGKYGTIPMFPIPEPSTWALLGLGGTALFVSSRARARRLKA